MPDDDKWYGEDGEELDFSLPETEPARREPEPTLEKPLVKPFTIFDLGRSLLQLCCFLVLFFYAAFTFAIGALAGFWPPCLFVFGSFAVAYFVKIGTADARRILVTVWLLAVTWVVSGVLFRPSYQGQSTACKSNLKNVGTACEMYATDNAGRYPQSLDKLTPSYLKTIPTCPTAGANTYSDNYVGSALPDIFTVFCHGSFHGNVGMSPNYPQYNALNGLVER